MIDFLQELQTIGLTALFNPTFLFLLVLLFFLGKLVGWMTRNINVWKFLALGYFGIFLFRPLQDAGLIIGGVFILGVASMYMDLFKGIFGWAGGFGDAISALRSRGAYEDIRRLEREVEALKAQLRSSPAGGSAADGTGPQASWRAQAQARKSKSKPGASSTGGRGDGSSSASSNSRGSGATQSSKSRGSQKSTRRGTAHKKRSSSNTGSYKASSRVSDGPAGGSKAGTSSKSSTQSKPNGSSKAQSTGARPNAKQSSTSQSQSGQKSAGSQNQGTSQKQQSTSGARSYTMSAALRDKYLRVLELAPGQAYTEKELKTAWRKMAFKTHPDKGGSTAAFSAVQEAYKALT